MTKNPKKDNSKKKDLKVAVVSDPLFKHGGAESHLKYIYCIPQGGIY